jgi:Cd2+/Zn2+-exporting ATPase
MPPFPAKSEAEKDSCITQLRVANLCCGAEEKLILSTLEPLPGVVRVTVNLVGRTAVVRHDATVTPDALATKLNALALGASVIDVGEGSEANIVSRSPEYTVAIWLVLFQLPLFSASLAAAATHAPWEGPVSVATVALGGGWIAYKAGKLLLVLRLDMHFIMLMAICAAVAIKDWTESATIAFVFSLAELLQQAAQHHVRTQIGKLAVSAPKTAALESGELIAIKDIVIGTQLVARSGERVAVDGLVTSGLAGVDESAVTGESAPQTRAPGLRVSAGTVVVSGYVSYTATSTASNSTLAHVKVCCMSNLCCMCLYACQGRDRGGAGAVNM